MVTATWGEIAKKLVYVWGVACIVALTIVVGICIIAWFIDKVASKYDKWWRNKDLTRDFSAKAAKNLF